MHHISLRTARRPPKVAAQLLALLWLGCSDAATTQADPSPSDAAPTDAAPPDAGSATRDRPAALEGAEQARVEEEEGWRAVFWRDGRAGTVGGGDRPPPEVVLVSADAAQPATVGSGEGPCGGQLLDDALEGAVLGLPPDAAAPTMPRRHAVDASLVERAAWRVDEILPPRDEFSSAAPRTAPAEQRGVQLGSVAKIKRTGAPPVFAGIGTRDCSAGLVVVDTSAERTLAFDTIAAACDKLALLPPADLDGDGRIELVAHSDELVVAWGLRTSPTSVQLSRLGAWTCEPDGTAPATP